MNQENELEHREFRQAILRLDAAFFGDENTKGMQAKINEMYDFFVPITLTGKFIIKGVILLGSIAAAILAIWQLLTRRVI